MPISAAAATAMRAHHKHELQSHLSNGDNGISGGGNGSSHHPQTLGTVLSMAKHTLPTAISNPLAISKTVQVPRTP
jgi:hypothetical protein